MLSKLSVRMCMRMNLKDNYERLMIVLALVRASVKTVSCFK